MRFFLCVWLCLLGGPMLAQELPYFGVSATSVLIVNAESLFANTRLGHDITALDEQERNALVEEGRKMGREFEAEELSLTELRDTLPADEFQALADAFDQKVVAGRRQQAQRDSTLLANIEARRQAFNRLLSPILRRLLRKYRAAAIIDQRSVLAFNPSMDITSEAIELMDDAYTQNPDMLNLLGPKDD